MQLSDIPKVGLDELIDFTVTALEPDRLQGSFPVTPDLLDGSGSVHRGVLSAVIETAASVAAAAWFSDRGHVVGVSNSTSHFATASSGSVDVEARPVDRQDGRQLWTVAVRDEDGRLLAQGDVSLANLTDAARLGR